VLSQVGSVVQDADGLTLRTSSPASATLELPASAGWTAVELTAVLDGEGAGFVALELGGGTVRVDFGAEGFDGSVYVLSPASETQELRVLLDATGTARARVAIRSVRLGTFPSDGEGIPPDDPGDTVTPTAPGATVTATTIPGPPNTGSGMRAWEDDPLVTGTAVLAVVIVVLIAAARWAMRVPGR
jgi:hypothetical protein